MRSSTPALARDIENQGCRVGAFTLIHHPFLVGAAKARVVIEGLEAGLPRSEQLHHLGAAVDLRSAHRWRSPIGQMPSNWAAGAGFLEAIFA